MTANRSSRMPLLLLGLLTFLNGLNFVDRQLVSSLAPLMKEDLALSNTDIGLLTGLYFVVVYTITGLVIGTLADKFNRPKIIATGLLIWSSLTAVSGAARHFWHLAAARLFVGAGEAALTPASMSMLSDTFPPQKRGLVTGAYCAGIPLGAGGSLLVAGSIGTVLGWRMCFYILGGVGVVVSGLLALMLKDAPRGAMEQAPAAAPQHHSFKEMMGQVLSAIRRSHGLLMTIAGSSVAVFAMQVGVLNQLWLVNERGFSQQRAALIFGVLGLFSGLLGNFLGGMMADWFHSKWNGGRLLFIACMQIVVMPFLLVFRFLSPDSVMFYVCAFLGGVYAMMIFGPCFATVQDLVPIRVRSTIVACLIFSQNVLGAAPGGYMAGKLCDELGKRGIAEPYTWGLFAIGATGLLTIPMFFYGARCYKRDLNRMHAEEAVLGETVTINAPTQ